MELSIRVETFSLILCANIADFGKTGHIYLCLCVYMHVYVCTCLHNYNLCGQLTMSRIKFLRALQLML